MNNFKTPGSVVSRLLLNLTEVYRLKSRHIWGRGDEMNVVQHKNKAIQFEPLVFLAVTQRLGQNLPAIVTVE